MKHFSSMQSPLKMTESKRGKEGGTPTPLTLTQLIDETSELLTNELTDIQTDIIEGVFDDETLPQIHDRVTYISGQLNLIREIKSICNNRGRY